MYHQITLVGNLGGDPELRYTPQGDAVVNFSLATNRRWTTRDGTPGEETTWFRISVWGKQAESCNQYLSKGRQVLVVGQMQPDKDSGGPRIWTDNEGNPRSSFEIRAFTVQFLGGNQQSDGSTPPSASSSSEGSTPASVDRISDDEIPF